MGEQGQGAGKTAEPLGQILAQKHFPYPVMISSAMAPQNAQFSICYMFLAGERQGYGARMTSAQHAARPAVGATSAGQCAQDGPDSEKKPVRPGRSLVYFGVHAPDIASDLVLYETVRQCIEDARSQNWALRYVRAPVAADFIAEINSSRGVVIGGDGLFRVDLDCSSKLGWQWPCPPKLMRWTDMSVIIYAVGYSRSRGQGELPAAFFEIHNIMIQKSGFISIRNGGSIEGIFDRTSWPEAAFPAPPDNSAERIGRNAAPRFETGGTAPQMDINAAFDRFGNRLRGRIRRLWAGLAYLPPM